MKCNCKTLKSLSFSERDRLKKELVRINDKFLNDMYKEQKRDICNNLLKIICIAMNESLGLGSVRLERVLEEINKMCQEEQRDFEDFWLDKERQCKRILGKEKYYRFFKDIPIKFDI